MYLKRLTQLVSPHKYRLWLCWRSSHSSLLEINFALPKSLKSRIQAPKGDTGARNKWGQQEKEAEATRPTLWPTPWSSHGLGQAAVLQAGCCGHWLAGCVLQAPCRNERAGSSAQGWAGGNDSGWFLPLISLPLTCSAELEATMTGKAMEWVVKQPAQPRGKPLPLFLFLLPLGTLFLSSFLSCFFQSCSKLIKPSVLPTSISFIYSSIQQEFIEDWLVPHIGDTVLNGGENLL